MICRAEPGARCRQGKGVVQHTVVKETETGECNLEVQVLSCKPKFEFERRRSKSGWSGAVKGGYLEKSRWKIYLSISLLQPGFCKYALYLRVCLMMLQWITVLDSGGVSFECSMCALLMSSNWVQHLVPGRPRSFHRGWGNTNKLGHTFFGSWAGWRERLSALEELKGGTHVQDAQTPADWGCRAVGVLAWVTIQNIQNKLTHFYPVHSFLGVG